MGKHSFDELNHQWRWRRLESGTLATCWQNSPLDPTKPCQIVVPVVPLVWPFDSDCEPKHSAIETNEDALLDIAAAAVEMLVAHPLTQWSSPKYKNLSDAVNAWRNYL